VSPSATLSVYVQPRAKRTEVAGWHGAAIKIRLAAPPADGRANAELVRFVARTVGIPPSRVEIVAGATGRRKTLRLHGLTPEEALQRLALPKRAPDVLPLN
jgi:hypothetical protein